MLKALTSWPAAAVAVLISTAAFAEEETHPYPECAGGPSDSGVKAAKGAFQAGQVAFEEGDYSRAITYWEDAFRRDCTAHAMLLNLARVYELGDRKQQAVIALETYLEREPNTGKRDQITRRIEVLRGKLEQEQQPRPEPATTPEPATGPAPPPVAVEPQPPPEDEGGKKPITPLIVAGAGGAVFLIGGVLYLGAAGDVSKWEDRCPDRQCPPEYQSGITEANDARTSQTVWGAVSLVGLAAGVGGVIWYLASPRSAPEPAGTAKLERGPVVTPAVGPGFTGLAVTGAF